MNASLWFWIVLAVLVAIAAVRRAAATRELRRREGAGLDDAAVQRIVDEGRVHLAGDDEPLDQDEIARAEEEFWDASWDEPEEYGR